MADQGERLKISPISPSQSAIVPRAARSIADARIPALASAPPLPTAALPIGTTPTNAYDCCKGKCEMAPAGLPRPVFYEQLGRVGGLGFWGLERRCKRRRPARIQALSSADADFGPRAIDADPRKRSRSAPPQPPSCNLSQTRWNRRRGRRERPTCFRVVSDFRRGMPVFENKTPQPQN
jgi:hypothetical protein